MVKAKKAVPEAKEDAPKAKKDFPFPEKLYYSNDGHYWVNMGKSKSLKRIRQVTIGLSRLGAEVYRIKRIWIKPRGTPVAKGGTFAGFVGDRAGGLELPISGTIISSNGSLTGSPDLIHKDPYKSGWMVVIKPSKLEQEIKKLQKVTSEKFKKLLEDKLKEQTKEIKKPTIGVEPTKAAEPAKQPIPILPEPFE